MVHGADPYSEIDGNNFSKFNVKYETARNRRYQGWGQAGRFEQSVLCVRLGIS